MQIEVVHWRMNLFKVPLVNSGKSFVAELARLYEAFASCSALKLIALMATTVLPILVLQLPHQKSKMKEHIAFLERHFKYWKARVILHHFSMRVEPSNNDYQGLQM